jgi:UDP-glucose 4-epimerase
MASRGSVIPLFIKQIKAGQPITVTDPDMTRFMMSIEGAVDLVLYAYEHANPGDIFVQKAPAATIMTLALALKQVFHAENPVRTIGTRHGEKLYETLLTREELSKAEDLGGYYRIVADNRDLNYNAYFFEGKERVSELQDYNSHNTHRLTVDELGSLLCELDYVKTQLEDWHK